MAEGSVQIEYKYTLMLNKEEATWLKSLLQNPIDYVKYHETPVASDKNLEIQTSIFRALCPDNNAG